jgi:hypothetical protein
MFRKKESVETFADACMAAASYQCEQLVALASPKLSFPAVFGSLLIFSCCAPPFGTHINNNKNPSAWIQVLRGMFSFPNSSPNSTMQKEDSPSHQNTGTYIE